MSSGKYDYAYHHINDENVKPKYNYNFSKVNLKEFSKKQLIRIIYDLKNQIDRKNELLKQLEYLNNDYEGFEECK